MNEAGPEPWDRSTDGWIVCVLLLAAVLVFGRDITVGGLRYSDACTHAMDGVLIHDWVAAGPSAWIDPIGFATRQYAHFPTLGIGRVYPPGFAVVEAAFFALLGISAFSARVCVLTFGLAAVAGGYVLCRRFLNRPVSVLSCAILLGMPGVVFWTRQTMLEMPTLAVCIWTAIALLRYVDRPGWLRLAVLACGVLACPLFKQTGAFMVPVVALVLAERAIRGEVPWRQVACLCAGVGVPLGVFFWFTLFAGGSVTHTGRVVSLGRSIGDWISLSGLLFYPRSWTTEVGRVVVWLGAAGGAVWLIRGPWSIGKATIVLWLVVFFAASVLVQHKEPRYFFLGYFPMAVLAAAGVGAVLSRIRRASPRAAAVCAVAVVPCVIGHRTTTMIQPDYSAVVSAHADRIRHRLVLFEGHRDGDFVFAARRVLGPRGCVVLRASKLFYACASDPRFSFETIAGSAEAIRSIIASLGLETIVVEQGNDLGIAATEQLQSELRDGRRYEVIGRWPFSMRRRSGRHVVKTVEVFGVIDAPARTLRFVELPIPIASTRVRVDLDELLDPRA